MRKILTATCVAVALATAPAAHAQTLNPNTVAACVSYVRVNSMFRPYSLFDAYLAPDGWVHFQGDPRDEFLFDKCMNAYGINPVGPR